MLRLDVTQTLQYEGRTDERPAWIFVSADAPDSRITSTEWKSDARRSSLSYETSTPNLAWTNESNHKRVYYDCRYGHVTQNAEQTNGQWTATDFYNQDFITKLNENAPILWSKFYYSCDPNATELNQTYKIRIGWVQHDGDIYDDLPYEAFINLTWNNQPEIEWGPYQQLTSRTGSTSISTFTTDSAIDTDVFVNGSALKEHEIPSARKASYATAALCRSRILVIEMSPDYNPAIYLNNPQLRVRGQQESFDKADYGTEIETVENSGTTHTSSGIIQINRTNQTIIHWTNRPLHNYLTSIRLPEQIQAIFSWRVSDGETWNEEIIDNNATNILIPANSFPRGQIEYKVATTLRIQSTDIQTFSRESAVRLLDTHPQFYISSVTPKNLIIPSGLNNVTITFANREDDIIVLGLYYQNATNPFYTVEINSDSTIFEFMPEMFWDDETLTASDLKIRLVAENEDKKTSEETITVRLLPYIIEQPTDITAISEQTVTLSVQSRFGTLEYWWYYRKTPEESWKLETVDHTKNYQRVTVRESMNGWQYYCNVQNETGSTKSNIMTLTILPRARITSQPQDQQVLEDSKAVFSVGADGTIVSYQWMVQVSDTPNVWVNIDNEIGPELQVNASYTKNRNLYRCAISDGVSTLYTREAKLTIYTELTIIEQPQNQTAAEGKQVTFSISATSSGRHSITYAWYIYQDSWKDASSIGALGVDTDALSFLALSEYQNLNLRCEVSNGIDIRVSNIATLSVIRAPYIIEHPQNQRVPVNTTAEFSIVARGDELAYQWQVSHDGNKWDNLPDKNDRVLTVQADSNMNDWQYRCIVSNITERDAYSNPAILYIISPPQIIFQPEDQTTILGESVRFVVSSNDTNAIYQWQSRNPGSGEWVSVSNGGQNILQFNAEKYQDGWQYRCIVSNEAGSTVSESASLFVFQAVEIQRQPQNQKAVIGEKVVFFIVASGTDLSYQWQKHSQNDSWIDMPDEIRDTIEVIPDRLSFDFSYRCIVSNEVSSVISEVARLEVELAKILQEPTDQVAIEGHSVQFGIQVAGEDLAYRWEWQEKASSVWIPLENATDSILVFEVMKEDDQSQYRCIILDASNNNQVLAISQSAKLTVYYAPKILVQPQSLSIVVGTKRALYIEADGHNLTYQWEVFFDGEWKEIGLPVKGGNSVPSHAIYSITGSQEQDGQKYRCRVTTEFEDLGAIESEIAIIKIIESPSDPIEPPISPVTDDGLLVVIDDGTPVRPQYYKPCEMSPAILDLKREKQWRKLVDGTLDKLITSATFFRQSAFQAYDSLRTLFAPLCSKIESNAFVGCHSLRFIFLPNCQEIGRSAFAFCSALQFVSLPVCSIVSSFEGCSDLSKVRLDACTVLGSAAFQNCRKLSDVSIPVCTEIGPNVFCSCVNLKKVAFPKCTSIGPMAFYDCALEDISFPVCREVGMYAFTGCNDLSFASFPACEYIGQGAFAGCQTLSSISFPNCLEISGDAFAGCSALSEVEFPLCTSLYFGAFNRCQNLRSISFPVCTDLIGSIIIYGTDIENNRNFAGSPLLQSFSFPNVQHVGSAFFAYFPFSPATFKLPECLTIGQYAFYSCKDLTKIELPKCTHIDKSAFQGCIGLSEMSLPNCQFIASKAFQSCRNLSTIGLQNCSIIQGDAFEFCDNLKSVYLMGSIFCSLEKPASATFYYTFISSGNVFVPASLYASYYGDWNWNLLQSRIISVN